MHLSTGQIHQHCEVCEGLHLFQLIVGNLLLQIAMHKIALPEHTEMTKGGSCYDIELDGKGRGLCELGTRKEQGLPQSSEKVAKACAQLVRHVYDWPLSNHAFCLTSTRIQVGGPCNENGRAARHNGHEILQERKKGTHSIQTRGTRVLIYDGRLI
jgi:hypothetical protein